MKTSLCTSILLVSLFLGVASAEPMLTDENATQLGRIILGAPENKKYKDIYWNANPTYEPNKGLWIYPVGLGASVDLGYTFEIRDADGYYRLGWLTPWSSSKGYSHFQIQPSIRSEVRKLLATSVKKRKKG